MPPKVMFPNSASASSNDLPYEQDAICWSDKGIEWLCGTAICVGNVCSGDVCSPELIERVGANSCHHENKYPPEQEECEPDTTPSSFSHTYPQQPHNSFGSLNSVYGENNDFSNNENGKMLSAGFVQTSSLGSDIGGTGMDTVLCQIPSPPPPSIICPSISFGLNANKKTVSQDSVELLKDILSAANEADAKITKYY